MRDGIAPTHNIPFANPPKGLSQEEARRRLSFYGSNEIARVKRFSLAVEFLLKFRNPLVFILILAALISGILGDRVSAGIIITIVLTSAILDFLNTYRSQKAAEALKEKVKITAAVIRSGKTSEVPLSSIVPGDIVFLSPGDIIPADGKVISALDFFVDESSLTGESFPAEKTPDELIFMGTSVITGNAIAGIAATGSSTKMSKIAESLLQREAPTEFERDIKDFGALIMRVVLILVLFIFLTSVLFGKGSILELFLFATALAVGLTPELLPMIITLNLSKGAFVMSKRGVIVKRLAAIQNFGSMDILCTDKTGTLTNGKIVLVKYVDGLGKESEEVFRWAYLTSVYESGFKNPLDNAVREFKKIDIAGFEKVDEIPFDYIRKRNSVVVEHQEKRFLLSKGAPEELFKISSFYGDAEREFDSTLKKSVVAEYHRLSDEGFRVLGVVKKIAVDKKEKYTRDDEHDMTFLGFVAFLDPPKKTVSQTLKTMENFGIAIKILTGDNELVSKKIARDIGLEVTGVLLGEEIEKLSDQELSSKVEDVNIFARVTPEEKRRIIGALRTRRHVVGYLGDGVNDAPSLRAADVGISVSNAVDVAKESADLILLHKSLHDLIEGVREGRKTFVNTLKYLMMALSSNFGNMFSMAGASLWLPFLPMTSVQIIFNNFLYDSSQLAIPLDTVDEHEIKNPQKWNINFIRKFMLIFGPVSSFFDFVTFFALWYLFHLTENSFQTGWFLLSVATQTLVIHIIRSRRVPLLESMPSSALIASTGLAVGIGWLVVYSGIGSFFKFVPLPLNVVLVIIAIVATYLMVVEFIKRWFYQKFAPE